MRRLIFLHHFRAFLLPGPSGQYASAPEGAVVGGDVWGGEVWGGEVRGGGLVTAVAWGELAGAVTRAEPELDGDPFEVADVDTERGLVAGDGGTD
jgi:hypothetical protein